MANPANTTLSSQLARTKAVSVTNLVAMRYWLCSDTSSTFACPRFVGAEAHSGSLKGQKVVGLPQGK